MPSKTSKTLIHLASIDARLAAMIAHFETQGETLCAIKEILEDLLDLRPRLDDHETRIRQLEGAHGEPTKP